MTPTFADLPLEILPHIFQFIQRPNDLTLLARTSKTFQSFAAPFIYSEVRVYQWHTDWKEKIVKLFATLANCPQLAQHVKVLVLKEFPREASSKGTEEAQALETTVLKAIPNLISLRSLSWTRDGTLTSTFLEKIAEHCPQLQSLELNGHSGSYYNPKILSSFRNLENWTIIMPDRPFVEAFRAWLTENGAELRSLTLISKQSPLIDDTLLEQVSSMTSGLKELYLLGNPRITCRGMAAISKNCRGLEALSIEGAEFDMQALSRVVSFTLAAFPSLTTLSLTLPNSSSPTTFLDSVNSVFRSSPLTEFTIWRAGGEIGNLRTAGNALPMTFLRLFLIAHGARLQKFAVQRMETSMEVIQEVVKRCPKLEKFFIVLGPCDMDVLASHLRRLKHLQTLHISYTFTNRNSIVIVPPSDSPAQASHPSVEFVKQCPPTLHIIGFMTRVYEVNRKWVLLNKNPVEWRKEPDVTLERYSGQAIPEAFLVMKA